MIKANLNLKLHLTTVISVFVLIAFCSGCSSKTEIDYFQNVKFIPADKPNLDQMAMSNIADSISYVFLDTPEELAIGQVDRIILSQDLLFVLDREVASALYVFDLEGRLRFDIQQGIGGPGEVIEFSDIDVSATAEEFYILDNESMDIKIFDFSGEFIRRLELPFFAAAIGALRDEIAIYRNNQFVEGDEYDNNQIMVISKEGKLKRGFLPIEMGTDFLSYHDSFRPFQVTDSSWIFSQALGDTIYTISGTTIESKYLIDFGNKALSKIQDGFFSINDFLQSEQRLESNYLMGDTFENSRFLLSLFYAGKTYKYVLYDKTSAQTYVIDKLINDLDQVPYLHTKFVNDEVMIGEIPAEVLLSINEQMTESADKTEKIQELIGHPVFQKENPIIMLIHLKKT